MMFSTFKKISITVVMGLLASVTQAQNTDDVRVDNKSTYHISDTVELMTATDVRYAKPGVIIKLAYPRLNSNSDPVNNEDEDNPTSDSVAENNSGNVDSFNQAVARTIEEEISHFNNQVADQQSYQQKLDPKKIKNRLTIDYSSAIVNLENDPLISIRFIVQGYASGMTKPYRRFRVVNFDMAAGREIELSELFKTDANYLQLMTHYASRALNKMLQNKTTNERPLTAEDFSNWNINLNGLRITFDAATFEPGNAGAQTILIPYSVFHGLINSNSSLGQCMKHQSSCMRDHLLTGGFIDEAANTRHRAFNPALG